MEKNITYKEAYERLIEVYLELMISTIELQKTMNKKQSKEGSQ